MNDTKQILSKTAIYGVGQLLRGLASFVMLPIYTTYLSTKDYGTVELLTLIVDLAALLIGSRLTVGIFKYYSDAETLAEKKSVIATSMILMMGLFSIAILILWLLSANLDRLLNIGDGGASIRCMAFILLISGMNEIFFALLRIKDLAVSYVAMNLFKLCSQIALSLLFVVNMGMGYWGVIWASLASAALTLLIFVFWQHRELGFRVEKQIAADLLKFSFPIILSSIGFYFITYGDRFFINSYFGMAAVGIYALSYKFGFLLFSLVWAPFSTYWGARQYDYAKQDAAGEFFGKVFFYVNIPLLFAAASMVVLTPYLIRLMSDQAFWSAIEIVPWVVLAYVVQCWTEFMRFGILNSKRTVHIAYATFLSLALIAVLYMVLIPAFGPLGAAIATLICFIVRFLYIFLVSQRFFKIDVPYTRLIFLMIYFGIIAVVSRLFIFEPLIGLVFLSVLMVLALVSLFLLPFMRLERKFIVTSISRYLPDKV